MIVVMIVIMVVMTVSVRPAAAFLAVDSGALEIQTSIDLVLVLGQHVGADDAPLLEVPAAVEIGRVVGVAAAVVDRGRRIRAKGTRARDAAGRDLGGDRVRRGPLF